MSKSIDAAARTLFAALVVGAASRVAGKIIGNVTDSRSLGADISAIGFSAGMITIGAALKESSPETSAASLTLGVASGVSYLAMRDEIREKQVIDGRIIDRALPRDSNVELKLQGYSSTGEPVYSLE